MAGSIEQTIAHVQDSYYFEVPQALVAGGKLWIPQPFGVLSGGLHPEPISGFCISKFMVLQVVVALLLVVVFIPVARRIATGERPRGKCWNFFEVLLLFIRDDIARAAIGKKDGDRFVPILWSFFFFILFCNLLGLVPWMGTATGAVGTTGVLAGVVVCVSIGAGSSKMGVVGFWKAQVPHIELPALLAAGLIPMLFVIEVLGLFIRHIMLAMRLFANMFAGHIVLVVLMGFIASTAGAWAWYGVMPASVFGCTAMMLLEVFVAFLQAYIFTFLSALWIGMAVHPH
ncbi:MAG: F0F1 ATP synthase subunit A [Planctomycetota bacterium]|nr:F0F1 ATP synthase subunit A [Planctomycetota bacterium]